METTNTPAVTPTTEQAPDQPTTLTQKEIVRAATNDPALADNEFTLGNDRVGFKTFKVVDLEYDSYIEFIAYLQPLFDSVMSKIVASANVKLPGIALAPPTESMNVNSLFKFCKKELPEMVRLVCLGSDPEITAEWIKKAAASPWQLAAIVLMQIEKNHIIQQFADFFVQMLPSLMAMGSMIQKQSEQTE